MGIGSRSMTTRADPIKILGLSGGMSSDSGALRLLGCARETASQLVEPTGPAVVDIFAPETLREIPHFEADPAPDEAPRLPLEARDICDALAEADAILVSTPEHHGSYPGVIKDVIDWVASPAGCGLQGVPAAVVGAASDGHGADWAQADVRKVLDVAGARVVAGELSVPRIDEAVGAEREMLIDQVLADRLSDLLGELALEARAARALN